MVKLSALHTGRLKKQSVNVVQGNKRTFLRHIRKNREKRLLASSCPSACLRAITRLPRNGF